MVDFYTASIEIARLSNMSDDVAKNMGTVRDLAPRLARTGYQLRAMLDVFENSGFDPESPLTYDISEIPARLRNL
jgi:hypothetical protein